MDVDVKLETRIKKKWRTGCKDGLGYFFKDANLIYEGLLNKRRKLHAYIHQKRFLFSKLNPILFRLSLKID